MAWIESHTDLLDHPKFKKLRLSMGWDVDTTIGKLHRFWWWCIRFAEDGDLRKFSHGELGDAMGLAGKDAKRFVNEAVRSGFLDREPFFRVHNWYARVSKYLYSKYHTSNPRKLASARRKHLGKPKGKTLGHPKDGYHSLHYPSLPNLTNQPKIINDSTSAPENETKTGDLIAHLLEEMKSPQSEGFYRKAIRELGPGIVEECLGEVRYRTKTAHIENPAAYLTTLLKERITEKERTETCR